MSDTTTAVVETPKAAKKAPAAKKATKPAPKAEKKAPAKSGLRKPQVRILKALAKYGKPMTRTAVSEKAPVDVAMCVEYLGSPDPERRKANDAKHFPSLVSLGLVKFASPEEEGGASRYEITPKGREAAKKAE